MSPLSPRKWILVSFLSCSHSWGFIIYLQSILHAVDKAKLKNSYQNLVTMIHLKPSRGSGKSLSSTVLYVHIVFNGLNISQIPMHLKNQHLHEHLSQYYLQFLTIHSCLIN